MVNCDRYKTGCYHCPQKKEYPSSYFLDQSKQNWERKKAAFTGAPNMMIITPSQWLAEIINDSYLKEYPIKIINNGIDLDIFSYRTSNLREKYSLQNKQIILGVAQNWAEHKGLEDFIKLSGMLANKYQVVMIGLTDDLIKKLPKSIIGLNRTNSIEELATWYSIAQVFVNFTYQDTFPTVNIEALACGTPIITYNTGGSPEAIDNTCGWIVDKGNIQKVVQIIEEMKEKTAYQEYAFVRSKVFDRRSIYQEYIS